MAGDQETCSFCGARMRRLNDTMWSCPSSPYCAEHRARCYTTRTAVAKLDLDAVGKVAA